MPRNRRPIWIAFVLAMLACGGSGSGGTGAVLDGGLDGAGGSFGGAGGAADSSVGGGTSNEAGPYASNGPGSCPGSIRPDNDEFCWGQCIEPAHCSATRPIEGCCVSIGEPGNSSSPYLERTTSTKRYADPSGGPPDDACFEPSSYPVAGGSKSTKLIGELRAFANGACTPDDLVGVMIEIFTVKHTGVADTEAMPDQPIGSQAIASDSPIITEPVTNQCVDGMRYARRFEVSNVPMYTDLVVKTSGTGWTTLHTYNVYLAETDQEYDAGTNSYAMPVYALAVDDFTTLPTVAIGTSITPGNALILGEVRDCANVRLQNSRVDVSAPRLSLEYFSTSEDDPLPDASRREIGTGATGLFTAIDVQAASEGKWVRVSAVGLLPQPAGARLVSLGYADVRVFSDSATFVALRGLRPFQVQ